MMRSSSLTFRTFPLFIIGAALSAAAPAPLSAQSGNVRVMRTPGPTTIWSRNADRAVLGVTLAAGSRADTAGVKLEEVDANGPAAKAGLKAGDLLTAINGTSLKVAKEDAEDLALAGLAQRRLQRVLAKAKPGDEVSLQVRSGSNTRTVSLKTVSAAELERGEVRRIVSSSGARAMNDDNRGMVGLSIGGGNTLRDTLGLFVNSVVTGGPAEKAGVVEGERVAAVNGVDVRVPREDVEDGQAVSARVDRFVREVQKVAPGGTVTLRVYGNGRYRDVAVKAAKASELPSEGMRVFVGGGDPQVIRFRTDSARPRIRINGREMEFDGQRMRIELDSARRLIEREMPRFQMQLQEELPRVRMQLQDELPRLRQQLEEQLPRLREQLQLLQQLPRSRRAVIDV
jgi:hypothetical protein